MNQTTVADAGVLFADIAGSTRLYETLGDRRAQAAINTCLEGLGKVAEKHNGRVVKTIGDEIMCEFRTAEDTTLAALAMQRLINEEGVIEDDDVDLHIRMGFHFGQVIPLGGDIFGDAVNIAARMAGIAKGDQIITTEATVGKMEVGTRSFCRKFDIAPIKGKAEDMVIYEVLWERRNVTQLITSPDVASPSVAMFLRLTYQGQELKLDATNIPCIIGRDPSCNLIVPSTYASRKHVRIEYRRGKFILIDQSTNGTYVALGDLDDDPEEIYLRREELPLMRGGVICLGESVKKGSEHAIRFDCD